MRKLLLLVLLYATPGYANSVPLQVTSGGVFGGLIAVWTDFSYTITGPHINLRGLSPGGFPFQEPTTTGVVPVRVIFVKEAIIDGINYTPPSSDWTSLGEIVLTQSRPFVFPEITNGLDTFPLGTRFTDTTTFTMTGHVDFGQGFDVVGQGVATGTFCHVCADGFIFGFGYRFTPEPVSVPEPSSLVVLAAGLFMVGGALRRFRKN